MFRDIIGHERNVESLRNVLRSGHIAGAYLFAGPPNVGKESMAMMFAQAIHCPEMEDDACSRCVSCRKVADGNHPDVRLIRPQGSWMKIDQVRTMQRQLTYRPMEGQFKVYLLTDAERMTAQAANSMLKTLEEPPGDAVIVLITTNYNALLPTIRSRCRALKFGRVPIETLASALARRHMLPEGLARQIAILASGDIGRAFEMAESSDEVELPEIPRLLQGIEPLEIFREAESFQKQPERLDVLLTWYRDLLMVKQRAPEGLLTYTQAIEKLKDASSRFATWQIQDAIQAIQQTKQQLQRNINSALALEVLVIRLANFHGRND